jgi:hypothetical protein
MSADVTYLDANFVRMKFAIKTLEKDGLPLADALKCIDTSLTTFRLDLRDPKLQKSTPR